MPLPALLRQANGDSAPPQKVLTIVQGGRCEIDWTISYNGAPLDLTGCTVACRIAASLDDGTTIAAFTGSIPVGSDGRIVLVLDEGETAALTPPPGSGQTAQIGVYDITLSDGTDTVVIAYGAAQLLRRKPEPPP